MIMKLVKKYKQAIATTIILFLIILIYLLVSIISETLDFHLYFGWKEVRVNSTMSFKVPDNWEQGEKNGLLYFCDKSDNRKIFLFQSRVGDCFQIGDSIKIDDNTTEDNICSNNFFNAVNINSSVNSLGTMIGEALVSFDGKSQVEDYIEFYNQDNVITLYTYGKAVDSKILDKIADSAKYTEK